MKIQVKRAKAKLWYGDKIGEIFEVTPFSKTLWALKDNEFYKFNKSDCKKVVKKEEVE